MYVCMCVYMYVCMYVCMYACMYVCMSVCTNLPHGEKSFHNTSHPLFSIFYQMSPSGRAIKGLANYGHYLNENLVYITFPNLS